MIDPGEQIVPAYTSTDPLQAGLFDGADYDEDRDRERLTGQLRRIYDCMADGVWRTVNEIHDCTGDPHNSISAQLRNLRKADFGKHNVPSRIREGTTALTEYRLVLP